MMFHEFIGEVVIHCHILSHEDAGMMITTEIVNSGKGSSLSTFSNHRFIVRL